MPVWSPKQCRKRPFGAPPPATMAFSSSPLATSHRLAAQLPAMCTWNGPVATRRRMRWSMGAEWWLCRGKCLAAVVVLPHPRACRSSGPAGTRGASRQVPRSALVGLPGKLLLPGPCPSRRATPAGVLSFQSKHFVLEWHQYELRRILADARQALPRDAATARAQVRDTKVPLL